MLFWIVGAVIVVSTLVMLGGTDRLIITDAQRSILGVEAENGVCETVKVLKSK